MPVRASQRLHVACGEAFVLHPGEFGLGSTIEEVAIPHDLVATVDGRSSIGRLAVVVHATAGFIDPGFQGQITLELSNIGPIPVKLSETPVDYHLPPPYCGQHTDQVLREMLHMSDDDLAALRAKKVI